MSETEAKKRGLVSPQQIAEDTGVSVRTVLAWAKQKRIPCVRINARVIRFDRAAVRDRLRRLQ